MNYLLIITVPLAVWRISNLFADTDQSGPFSILDKIRMGLGVRHDEYSRPYAKRGSMGDMLICTYCNSIWIGLLFTIGLLLNSEVTFFVSLPFALSTLTIFIEKYHAPE